MLNFAPKIFKEILGNLPTIIFKSVDIKEILIEAAPFVLGFAKGELAAENKEKLCAALPEMIHLTKESSLGDPCLDGSLILELYFNQFLNPEGLVLDIRSKYFSRSEKSLNWSPNNTWYKFKDEFRLGLINLYTGFYTDNQSLYSKGLNELGLSTNLTDEKENELKSLFNNHFGNTQTAVSFDTEAFNNSFSNLFSFFIENKVKIKTDFIFLGIYLVTLYQTMEEIGGSYNVEEIFLKSFKLAT